MFATLLTLIVLATSIASGIAGVAAAMAACYHRPTIRQLTRAVATLVAIGLGAWVVVAMANTSLLVALAGTMVIVTATIGATIQFGAAFLIGKLTRFQQS